MFNVERTHCVTFTHEGTKYYGVESHQYTGHDKMAEGISHPEVRCAMSEKRATDLANVIKAANFANVKICKLVVKPKRK